MSDLTQHVEQLAKEVEPAPCERPCNHIRCQAARLMTAMAKVIGAYRKWDEEGMEDDFAGNVVEANEELDDLVQKGTH